MQQACHGEPTAGERISALESIPPMPRQSRQILAAVSDPDIEIAELVTLIERCPPLAARIMSVACSAFFARDSPARSVSDAVVRVLGLRLVRDLSFGIVLTGSLRVGRCTGFCPQRYWTSAMGTAILADRLWPRIDGGAPPQDVSPYLAGLLHNLGVLALAHACPLQMSQALRSHATGASASLRAAETALLGLDHARAGAHLAHAWALPEAFSEVMLHHDSMAYRGRYRALAWTVGLCRHRLEGERPPDDPRNAVQLEALAVPDAAWHELLDIAREDLRSVAELAPLLAGRGH